MKYIKATIRTYLADSLLMTEALHGLDDDTSFQDVELLDEDGLQKLAAFIEARFEIRIPPEQRTAENLGSLNAIERYVRSRHVPSPYQPVIFY